MIDLDIRCKDCDRYLGLKGIHTIIAEVRCPNSKCKSLNQVKVVTSESSEQDLKYKFEEVKDGNE